MRVLSRHKLFVLIFCLVGLYATKANAQNTAIDDIKHKIAAHHKSDTILLKMYLELTRGYMYLQSDSALKYAGIAHDMAQKVADKKLYFKALSLQGQSLSNKGALQKAMKVFEEAEKVFTNDAEHAETIRNQGNINIELGKPDDAIGLYKKAMPYADRSKDKFSVCAILSNISYVYRQQGKYPEAADYQLRAIKIAGEIKDPSVLANCQIQLALIQYSRKLYPDAEAYAKDALAQYKRVNNQAGISMAYTIIGGSSDEKKDYATALDYLTKAYQTNIALGDTKRIAAAASTLGELEVKYKHYDRALAAINISLDYVQKTGVLYTTIDTYITKARINVALNKPDEAHVDIDKALEMCRQGSFKMLEKKALEVLALIHSAKGNYANAFETQLRSSALNDSLLNEANSKQMNELRTKYETDKKEKQIVLLNTQNHVQQLSIAKQDLELDKRKLSIKNQSLELSNKNLVIGKNQIEIKQRVFETRQQKQRITNLKQQTELQQLQLKQKNIFLALAVIAAITILLIGYLFYSRHKAKAQIAFQQKINYQQELTAREILDAEERERRRMGGDLHDGVGQLLSTALLNLNQLIKDSGFNPQQAKLAEQSLALVTDGYDEVRSISHQIIPNALLKYGLSAAVRDFLSKIDERVLKVSLESVGLNERLDEQTETVLYRVIQESVNNVIKHAKASKLTIQLVKDEEGLSLTIEDNGKGFDIKAMGKADGIGMKNIQSRVAFLKGDIDIQSSPGKGTLVSIFIPV